MTGLGPFEVAAEQVEGVGASFTRLVNQLLSLEVLRAQMRSHQLRIDSQDESPDGGVDAQLLSDSETMWIPRGVSTWQFKRGDLEPAKCRKELRDAKWAQDLLRNGATYILVLGRRLTPEKVSRRVDALVAEAKKLGLGVRDEQVHVLDANQLAAWASEFPALAVSQVLGGPGYGAVDFDLWSRSNRHQTEWTSSEERDAELIQIRSDIESPDRLDIRVQGVSGLGKTRLVLEALRGSNWEPLVAYVPEADDLSPEFLNHAMAPSRTVLLVVDECDSRRHEKLAERIPTDSLVRLVTVGQDDSFTLRSPVIVPAPLTDEALDEFLKRNYLSLPAEAIRFVVSHAGGNVRWAMILAERSLRADSSLAAELIRQDDIGQFASELIPEGRLFSLAAVLALFDRVGWDRDVRTELEALAHFAGATVDEFDATALDLERRGLLARHGRFRAVAPHPLAVVLAAGAWKQYGSRLVTDLIPNISNEMALALFSRVADLGSYEPARSALRDLMTPTGPFGTLESIESRGLGPFLTKLAVVLPDEASEHLASLIDRESLASLRSQTRSRRELVWTLEKLVWHSRTFERAADALLRLALAENETYGNNATGIWVSLFAAALPATAASPVQRVSYLRQVMARPADEVRLLVIQAARANLHPHESVMVSGEIQGGVLVEPRGSVRSATEALEYRGALIDLLRDLHLQASSSVASEAAEALISAVHPLIDKPIAGPALRHALVDLDGDDLARLRKEIESLRSLFRRHPKPSVEAALDDLASALPTEEALDRLRVLTDLDPWSFQDEEHTEELEALVRELAQEARISEVLGLLNQREIASGWHLGHALARAADEHCVERSLVDAVEVNLPALAGFLSGRISKGDAEAFDRFFASKSAMALSDDQALALAVRGPATAATKRRIGQLLKRTSVHEGAIRLFGWQKNLESHDVAAIVQDWLERMVEQFDYSAAVDWVSLWFHRRQELPAELIEPVTQLVVRRSDFPDMGQQAWDWAQLARLLTANAPAALARVLLDLVSEGMLLHGSSEDAELLGELASADPQAIWGEIATRLESGDWRLSMSLRGWITRHVPFATLKDWTGDDVARARVLAHVAMVGAEEPTAVAEFLLSDFGSDDEVQAALAAEFVSGSWVGPWSSRIRTQIEHLDAAWQAPNRPEGVRGWARRMKARLEVDLTEALEREAEENR